MVETKVFKLDPFNPGVEVLRFAANVIVTGGLVAFPTETVYGLGANAFNEDAARRVYVVKGRPLDNPVIVHICDVSQLDDIASSVPEDAYRLIERLWPGPLTLLLPRNPRVPYVVTGGLESVAVRMPAHPVALGLIRESGVPIAAPSANLSGKPSPTRGDHVIEDLYSKIEVILDAGETLYGVESTIVNLLVDPPVLLRPGAYPVEDIERVLGKPIRVPEFARGLGEAGKALAPGMRYRHYAPDTPLVLIEPTRPDNIEVIVENARKIIAEYRERGLKIAVIASKETASSYEDVADRVLIMGSWSNLYEIAKNLFTILRLIDKMGVDIAVVEGVEERGLGLAIMNRLRKASSRKIKV